MDWAAPPTVRMGSFSQCLLSWMSAGFSHFKNKAQLRHSQIHHSAFFLKSPWSDEDRQTLCPPARPPHCLGLMDAAPALGSEGHWGPGPFILWKFLLKVIYNRVKRKACREVSCPLAGQFLLPSLGAWGVSVFQNSFSLWGPGCPKTSSVDQASLLVFCCCFGWDFFDFGWLVF